MKLEETISRIKEIRLFEPERKDVWKKCLPLTQSIRRTLFDYIETEESVLSCTHYVLPQGLTSNGTVVYKNYVTKNSPGVYIMDEFYIFNTGDLFRYLNSAVFSMIKDLQYFMEHNNFSNELSANYVKRLSVFIDRLESQKQKRI